MPCATLGDFSLQIGGPCLVLERQDGGVPDVRWKAAAGERVSPDATVEDRDECEDRPDTLFHPITVVSFARSAAGIAVTFPSRSIDTSVVVAVAS